MRKGTFTKFRSAPVGLLFLASCAMETPTDGVEQTAGVNVIEKTTSDGTRILRSGSGRLTLPSLQAPETVAANFILSRAVVANAEQLSITAKTQEWGSVTHVKVEQVVEGLRVHGAYGKIAISERGEVLQSIERFAKFTGKLIPAKVTARDALATVMTELGYTESIGAGSVRGNFVEFLGSSEMYRNPIVEKVAYPEPDGSLGTGFLVETWSNSNNQLDYTLLDGSGAIISVERRTNNDSYNVFIEDPLKGPQTIIAGPGAGNAVSPIGWLGTGSQTTNSITGNNVRAYLDIDANNAPDASGISITNGNFVTAANLTQAPSTTGNRAVAVQNLFYLNNFMHDQLYQFGFTESNGNFQSNNFGLGGAGNDPVNAEAQDGSGTDNANFATPTDGSSPRMQMFLWTGTGPDAFVTVGTTNFNAFSSTFGAAPTATGTAGPLAVYSDGVGVSSDGCEASTVSLTGKVAIVDRGICNFTTKVLNAQLAGAKAVVIVNNVSTAAFKAGGTDRKVKAPSVMVNLSDRAGLVALAGQSANVRKNTVVPLQIDGDIDADIVFHEYGHGLTHRMIGGMSGKLAGAIGEGASDVLAFLNNGDDVIGEYSFGSALGIRRFPYTNYPLTYSDVDGGEVHNDGEVYAGAMWRVMENYVAAGLSIDDVFADFINGMNFTPSSPAFEDMRDGMLQSAAGTSRECLIWRGFAATGIGLGADSTLIPSGTITITESFALPANCQ